MRNTCQINTEGEIDVFSPAQLTLIDKLIAAQKGEVTITAEDLFAVARILNIDPYVLPTEDPNQVIISTQQEILTAKVNAALHLSNGTDIEYIKSEPEELENDKIDISKANIISSPKQLREDITQMAVEIHNSPETPHLIVVTGLSGAGKSTFYKYLLATLQDFGIDPATIECDHSVMHRRGSELRVHKDLLPGNLPIHLYTNQVQTALITLFAAIIKRTQALKVRCPYLYKRGDNISTIEPGTLKFKAARGPQTSILEGSEAMQVTEKLQLLCQHFGLTEPQVYIFEVLPSGPNPTSYQDIFHSAVAQAIQRGRGLDEEGLPPAARERKIQTAFAKTTAKYDRRVILPGTVK